MLEWNLLFIEHMRAAEIKIIVFSLRTNLHQCCKFLITCQLLMMESDPKEISKANPFKLYR